MPDSYLERENKQLTAKLHVRVDRLDEHVAKAAHFRLRVEIKWNIEKRFLLMRT